MMVLIIIDSKLITVAAKIAENPTDQSRRVEMVSDISAKIAENPTDQTRRIEKVSDISAKIAENPPDQARRSGKAGAGKWTGILFSVSLTSGHGDQRCRIISFVVAQAAQGAQAAGVSGS